MCPTCGDDAITHDSANSRYGSPHLISTRLIDDLDLRERYPLNLL
jgi:hypothetical protein